MSTNDCRITIQNTFSTHLNIHCKVTQTTFGNTFKIVFTSKLNYDSSRIKLTITFKIVVTYSIFS